MIPEDKIEEAGQVVTIPKEEYDELLSGSEFLGCLFAAGVDSWDGYDYAQELRENP